MWFVFPGQNGSLLDQTGGSMSVIHSAQKKMSKNVSKRAARWRDAAVSTAAMIEGLEERRLMAATLTVVNPDALPSSDRVIFNYVQNPDTTTPNVVHDTQALDIENTGDAPLVISSIAISGPWQFVGAPTGGYAGTSIAAGATLPVTLQFTQRTLPAHTYNETNYTTTPNGGAVITGTLTINTNDATTPSKVVTLAGYWQQLSNQNTEPGLQTIVNLLSGYKTNINSTPIPDLTEQSTPVLYGSEVAATSWEAAIPSQQVSLQQLGAFRTEGNNAAVYWYTASNQVSNLLFNDAANQGQTLLPTLSSGANAAASFTPTGAFGFRVDNEYSTDSINVAAGNTGGGGHHFRFFPLVDASGNTVPNTYIVTMDYGTLQTENFDFNDNVFVVSNIRPATTPETPSGFTATSGASPVLTWTADSYTPVAYNILSSSTSNGTFTQLNSAPITTTTYTDTTNTGAAVYYELEAVDSTQVPVATSFPATTSSNTGPIAISDNYNAFVNQTLTFNPLLNDIDHTGTLNPATVTITAPNHGGTATVDPTNGNITYTAGATFTGNENFTYTVTDSNGQTSTPATITVQVTNPIAVPPVANNEVVTTLANNPLQINVLSVDDATTTFNPASVTITTQPSSGNVAVDPTTGLVTYTPSTNFVGGDEFQYTVADSNSATSNVAIVNINVGTEISSAKGAARTLTYNDENGTAATITINRGIADVYFDGIGTVVSTLKGKTTVAGSSLRARQITLSGTTAASVLSITGKKGGQVNLGGVSDASPLGAISAATTNLRAVGTTSLLGLSTSTHPLLETDAVTTAVPIAAAGTVNLAGVRSISLRTADAADFILGAAGVASTSLTFAGTITDTALTASVPISTIKAKAWIKSAEDIQAINALSIANLVIAGEFDPDLTLDSAGRVAALGNARIGGAVSIGGWHITGNARAISVGTVSPSWGGVQVSGNLASFSVLHSGLTSGIIAGSINTLKVAGTLSATVTTTGNLLTLQAGGLVDALIDVGTTANSVAAATAANIGTATLRTLHITGRTANSFSDSSVIADVIDSATTGPVNAANGGTPEGLAATVIKGATVTADGGVLHLSAKTLISDAALSTFLTSKGATLGTFSIDII
jgi:hypothetical protein